MNNKIPVPCNGFLHHGTHFLVLEGDGLAEGNSTYSYKYYHPYVNGEPYNVIGVNPNG